MDSMHTSYICTPGTAVVHAGHGAADVPQEWEARCASAVDDETLDVHAVGFAED